MIEAGLATAAVLALCAMVGFAVGPALLDELAERAAAWRRLWRRPRP